MIRIPLDLAQRLEQAVRDAQQAGDLPLFDIPPLKVTHAPKPEHGDYATPAAMQLAKPARLKPEEIVKALISHFPSTDYVESVEGVGGFVNFRLSDAWLQRQVDAIIAAGDDFGRMDDFAGQRAQVECVSANPTGPISVHRIRGGVIGDTLARLLRSMGYTVDMEYYYNDAGRQMDILGQSLRARYLERLGLPVEFPAEGYQGHYIYDLADELIAAQGNALIEEEDIKPFKDFACARISEMQKASLARVGILFDNYFSEQSVYANGAVWQVLDQLREKGLVYEALHPEKDEDADERPDAEDLEAVASGSATWLRSRQLRGAQKDCALVKSSGEPTYRLPDIAYHVSKLDRGYDPAVNILGADHIEQFKDVKAAAGALGYDAERIQVVIHQFVTLVNSEGERESGSTKKGVFVALDDLVDDVGMDAVRYFMLARSADSRIDFDIDLARKKSNENPVYYIQNAHVRCASIARVAAERGVSMEDADVHLLTDPRELALIRKLIELPEIVEQAVRDLAPHKLAFWAHEELARLFHPTYEDIRALHSDVPVELAGSRLKLYAAAKIVLARTLSLMGMSAPEQM
ncbi:MAG: arginine--tRNA ligase [Anaerolineae bacterium]|nr:arginine--tRNA ligase [Anaerolineae bacterium]